MNSFAHPNSAPSWSSPVSIDRTIDRPRLLEALDGRFHRKLTVVRGGAGFGKTILLSQALEANREDPAGIDVWLSCRASDEGERSLASALRAVFGLEDDGRDVVEAVADAIWRRSPNDVALVLDDAHRLGAGTPGARLLESLFHVLPENGHLVLATRGSLPFAITRWIAAGEVTTLDDETLAFDEEERSRFLADRGLDGDSGLGGWPAGLELAAAVGASGVGDYLWEEVLSAIDPARLRALARLVDLDWVDDARVAGVAGSAMTAEQLFDGMPLVSTGERGERRLHALWQPTLRTIDAEWDPASVDAAVEWLSSQGFHRESLELAQRVGSESQVDAVVSRFAGVSRWLRASTADLEAIVRSRSEATRARAVGRFVEGVFRIHVDPEGAFPLIVQAREDFRAGGEIDLEVSALNAMAMLGFFAGSGVLLRQVAALVLELDYPSREELARSSLATAALLEGRAAEALPRLDAARDSVAELRPIMHSTLLIAALDAGEPERALRISVDEDEQLPHVIRASIRASRLEARGLLGRLDEGALQRLSGEVANEDAGHLHNSIVLRSTVAFFSAAAGLESVARELMAGVALDSHDGLGPRAALAVAAGQMMVAVSEGRGEEGRALFADASAEAPEEARYNRHSLRALPQFYVLAPDARDEIDALSVGSCYARGLEAARALVALRERGDAGPATALDWGRVEQFRSFLVPDLVLELSLAAATAGERSAEDVARDVAGRRRSALSELTNRLGTRSEDQPRVALARRILGETPRRPSERLSIGLLGPLEVRRDGVIVQHPALARQRVRALLQRLAWKGRASRDELADALWPELDGPAASNNLRVNLNHLINALEPARESNAPPYFVRSESGSIRLESGSWLVVDSEEFQKGLDEAERLDRAGRTAAALAELESALPLYRGDFLSDAPDASWGEMERVRLRARFIAGCVRAAGLLVGRSRFEDAHRWLEAALAEDELAEDAYRLQAIAYFRKGDRRSARAVVELGLRRLDEAGLPIGADLSRFARRLGVPADVRRTAS